MKNSSFIFSAFAALAIISCAGSDNTVIKGRVAAEDSAAEIRVKAGDVDTLVTVTDGAFSIEIPADVTQVGYVKGPKGSYGFISDGSVLTFDFSAEEVVPVSSAKKECAAYFALQNSTKEFVQGYRAKLAELQADETLSQEERDSRFEEYYDAAYESFVANSKDVIAKNSSNAVSLVALQNIYNEYDPEELLDVIAGLAPQLQAESFVQSLVKSSQPNAATSEGKMFTDFEVETEEGKFEKLSDYVGKGKYMLVDFWASWCGPCKAEIPNLKQVYEQFHSDKFDILSVAVWDQPQASVDTAKAYSIPWNHMINAQKIPTDIYGIQGIPHIILFGPDRTILKRNLRGEDIAKAVAEYVK